MIFWVVDKVIEGYIISTLTFLLLVNFSSSFRKRKNVFLNKANLVIVFVLLLNMIWTGEETIRCLVSEDGKLKYFPTGTWSNINRSCATLFYVTLFFSFLFQSLFFFNRHRIKVAYTVISVLLLTVSRNYERLFISFTELFQEFPPSRWMVRHEWTETIWTIVFSVLYFAFCWANRLILKDKELLSK